MFLQCKNVLRNGFCYFCNSRDGIGIKDVQSTGLVVSILAFKRTYCISGIDIFGIVLPITILPASRYCDDFVESLNEICTLIPVLISQCVGRSKKVTGCIT